MPDPTFASLDIETYGILEGSVPQTCFSPRRCLFVDRPPFSSLINCVSLTLPASPLPPLPSLSDLASMVPGPTLVFDWSSASDQRHLLFWLRHLRTLTGFNLQFDLTFLRAASPLFRSALSPARQFLVDASHLCFLENPSRPEKSLKSILLALGIAAYSETSASGHRFKDPAAVLSYCAQDTHGSLILTSTMARRILGNPLLSPHLGAFTLQLFSDNLWSCVQMSENGVPFHRPSLLSFASRLHRAASYHSARCLAAGLQLSGVGSESSKLAFMESMLDASSIDLRSHPLVGYSAIKNRLQVTEANRTFISTYLPSTSPLSRVARHWDSFSRADKLLGTYCFPLLWGSRRLSSGVRSRKSILTPQSGLPFPPLPEPPPCLLSYVPSDCASSNPSSSSALSSPSETSLTPPTPSSAAGGSSSPPGSSFSSSNTFAPRSSNLTTRTNHDVWLSHTSWFITPSAFKDGQGGEGGTKQGRRTPKDGAHQTDPPPIQACVRSRWHSGCILSADASQIELRVPAITSGEPSYVNAFIRGDDMHTATALLFWDLPTLLARYPSLSGVPLSRWKRTCPAFDARERQVGKRGNFARGYRAGPDKIQSSVYEDIGELIPLPVFQKFTRNMSTDTPLLWQWQESLIATAHSTGSLVLPITGQSRQFGGTLYDINEICNFPIQTIAGNTLISIHARFMHTLLLRSPRVQSSILPVLDVYDALRIDCRSPAYALLASRLLRDAVTYVQDIGYWHLLSAHYGHFVPLVLDFKTLGPFP